MSSRQGSTKACLTYKYGSPATRKTTPLVSTKVSISLLVHHANRTSHSVAAQANSRSMHIRVILVGDRERHHFRRHASAHDWKVYHLYTLPLVACFAAMQIFQSRDGLLAHCRCPRCTIWRWRVEGERACRVRYAVDWPRRIQAFRRSFSCATDRRIRADLPLQRHGLELRSIAPRLSSPSCFFKMPRITAPASI